MAVDIIGNMAARLGLDPSEFLDKMKGVQGFNGLMSAEMARSWKKAGRDGQEGMRLIDEALGIHVARPVARIVAETFPAFSKAMSGILTGVAFSALGLAVIEFGEHIVHSLDEAKKREEAYAEAVRKTKTVAAEAGAENAKRLAEDQAKLASLRGDKGAEYRFRIQQIDIDNVERLAKQVDALAEAERREAVAAAERQKWTAKAGEIGHTLFHAPTTLRTESINDTVREFQEKFADLSRQDALDGTNKGAEYLKQQLEDARKTLDAMKGNRLGTAGEYLRDFFTPSALRISGYAQPEIDAQQKKYDALLQADNYRQKNDQDAQTRKDIARAEEDKKRKETADGRAKEIRAEIAELQRLAAQSVASASATDLLSEATGKGTAETIRATAAADAQRKIEDARAQAESKLDAKGGHIATDPGVQRALADYAAIERRNALLEATARASQDLTRQIAELRTRTQEHVSALKEEAAGHGHVATEQARNLQALIPLQAALQGLKDLYASLPAGDKTAVSVGPPTAGQAAAQTLAANIAKSQADLDALRGEKGGENSLVQTGAFEEELKRIQERTAAIGNQSPWAKIDAEVTALTAKLRGMGQSEKDAGDQATRLRDALVAEQNKKIGEEFTKLAERVREARIETEALATGSPLAKLTAEAAKLGREWGLDAQQIAQVRAQLTQIQDLTNIGKAWEGVDTRNAGGGRMQELQQQMAALQRASFSGRTDDGIALSADALAAVRLEMVNIAEEENKIRLQTGGITAGVQAWLTSLENVDSTGKMVFDELSQASKSFEDTTAKSIIAIMETHANEHQKLVHELRRMWESFFAGLAQSAIKGSLAKLLQPIAGLFTQKQKTVNLGPGSADQFAKGPGALFSGLTGAKGGAGVTALPANTAAIHANTTALSANTAALNSSKAAGGAGVPGLTAPAGGNASGTDFWGGGSSWVGEMGPELVNLPRGSQVVPNDAMQPSGGGDVHITNDFSGSILTDEFMRKADAIQLAQLSEDRGYSRAITGTREMKLRSRPDPGR